MKDYIMATTGIQRVFNTLVQFPEGLTSKELAVILEDKDKKSASSNLSHLVNFGLARKTLGYEDNP